MTSTILRIACVSAHLACAAHVHRGQTASANVRNVARYNTDTMQPFTELEYDQPAASAAQSVSSLGKFLALLLSFESSAAFSGATTRYATPPSPLVAGRRIAMAADPDADSDELKRLQAERLALKAQIAELEAERLSVEADASKSDSPGAAEQSSVPSQELTASGTIRSSSSPAISQLTATGTIQSSTTAAGTESPPGTSLQQLLAFLDSTGMQAGLNSTAQLKQIVSKAWDTARVMQRDEITKIRRILDLAGELKNASQSQGQLSIGEKFNAEATKMEETLRVQSEQILVPQLVEMSQNRSGSLAERRARARVLTRAAFKFLAKQAPDDTEEKEEEVPVPGEGLVSLRPGLLRLRLLEQHERAGCVEYRFFAAALADDDMFAEAAGTSNIVTSEQANILPDLVASWFSPEEVLQEVGEIQGKQYLEEMEKSMKEMKTSNVMTWLKPLSDLLKQDTSFDKALPQIGNILGLEDGPIREVTLFPLLVGYCGFTQGNFEPLVVYYFARVLARFNAQEIARCEGRDVAGMTDAWVSRQEAEILAQPTQEALQIFISGFIFAAVVQISLFTVAAYYLIDAITNAFTPPAVDPLAF